MTYPAVCASVLPNGRTCGVTAIGTCASCYEPFCISHRAQVPNGRYQPYTNWCLSCQHQRTLENEAAERAEQSRESARKERARQRLPQLLAEFRRGSYSGARNRIWTESTLKSSGFFSTGQRYKRVQHTMDPAIPIGKLQWLCRPRGGHPDIDWKTERVEFLESGITDRGDIVPMDAEYVNYSLSSYRLREGQEVALCEALEALIDEAR